MGNMKMPAKLKSRYWTACAFAALAAAAPLNAAKAQGQRDIPAPQAENSSAQGQNQGDFPSAPSVYGQDAAGQNAPAAAPMNQNGQNPQINNAAPLWPSVAAESAGQNQHNEAAPLPNPAGQGQSPGAGQAAGAPMPPGANAGAQQAICDLQNQVQILKNRLDSLESQQRQGRAAQSAAQPGQKLNFGAAGAAAAEKAQTAQAAAKTKADDEQNYAAPANISADALYRQGEDFMAQGYYAKAALVWRAFAARFGQDARAAQAGFNLGECYYARGLYGQAAEAYLEIRNHYQDAAVAPRNLLRLAQSIANLQDSQTACATLDALQREYPHADSALLAQAAAESSRLQCP